MRLDWRARATPWGLTALALALLTAGPALAQGKKGKDMEENPLGLEDGAYWDHPVPGMKAIRKLRRARFDGVVLGAPRAAGLDKDTIPLVALRAGTYKQCAALDYGKRAILTLVHVERNAVHVQLANQNDNQVMEGYDDGGAEQEGYTSSNDVIDLKERFQITRPGNYIATMILRDRVSNRVTIQVEPSKGAYDDAEVRKLLREEAEKIQCSRPFPRPAKEGIPSYVRDEASLEVPAERGIVLEAANRVVLLQGDGGASSILRGAFRLPVRIHEVYKPHLEEEEDAEKVFEDLDPKPTAVLKVMLVAVEGDHDGWERIALWVPIYEPIPGAEEGKDPEVTGQFAVDLFSVMPRLKKRAQTYFVYAFSNAQMAGPALTAVVTEDMLPKRDE